MRNEILTQRKQLEEYKSENTELKDKVNRNMNIFDNVYETLKKIEQFRDEIEKERETVLNIVYKSQNDCSVLFKKFTNVNESVVKNQSENLSRLVNLETKTSENSGRISALQKERMSIHKQVSDHIIIVEDLKYKVERDIKSIDEHIKKLKSDQKQDCDELKSRIDQLGLPVMQALEKNQREGENMMYELKRCQAESRDIYGDYEKIKADIEKLLESLEANKAQQDQSYQNTISMIDMNTKIIMPHKTNSESIISTTFRNAPISPLTQARTDTANTNNSKISTLSKLPNLSSKHGLKTARHSSRNAGLKFHDPDYRTQTNNPIKESEEDILVKDYSYMETGHKHKAALLTKAPVKLTKQYFASENMSRSGYKNKMSKDLELIINTYDDV